LDKWKLKKQMNEQYVSMIEVCIVKQQMELKPTQPSANRVQQLPTDTKTTRL
jgi:hypothetical protein